MGERTFRGTTATLAVGLTVAGSLLLSARRWGIGPQTLLIAAGVGVFVWALRGRFPSFLVARLERRRGVPTAWLLAAAFLLSASAAVWSVFKRRPAGSDYTLTILLWSAAILAFVAAVVAGRGVFDEAWSRIQSRRGEWAAILVVTLLAGALRFYRLGSIPAVIDGDEGLIGMAALELRGTPMANPFASVDNVGGWYLRALSATIDLLGRNPLALRFLTALSGALAVAAVVLLGRRLFGARIGLYAGLLLAVSHAHIHFSRISSVLYVVGTFLGPVALSLFFRGFQNRSWRRLGLAGLVLGLHACIYLDAIMIGGAILLFLVAALVFCRPLLLRALPALPALVLGVAVAALPALAWASRNPNAFFARFAADGTFQTGFLEETAAQTGMSTPAILAGRVAHAFLTLIYHPAIDFYGTSSPLLGPITAAFFLLGMAVVTARAREPGALLVAVTFWSLTAMIGVFALPPSADSYRMLVTLPVVMIAAAVGIDGLFGALALNRVGRARELAGVATLAFLPIAAWNLHSYFGRFAGRCLFWGDPTTRISSHLGRYLSGLPPDTPAFLLADDQVRHGLSPSLDFLSGGRSVTNWTEPAASLRPEVDIVLVAAPSRVGELEAWARENPGGTVAREYECQKLLFATYRPPGL